MIKIIKNDFFYISINQIPIKQSGLPLKNNECLWCCTPPEKRAVPAGWQGRSLSRRRIYPHQPLGAWFWQLLFSVYASLRSSFWRHFSAGKPILPISCPQRASVWADFWFRWQWSGLCVMWKSILFSGKHNHQKTQTNIIQVSVVEYSSIMP